MSRQGHFSAATRLIALSLTVLALVAAILYTSKTFQACVQGAGVPAGEQVLHDPIAKLSMLAAVYRACAGSFIHEHRDDLIAVFLVVLAFSTIGLWTATKRLYAIGDKQATNAQATADAAKMCSEALLAELRAYVFAVSAKVIGFQEDGPIRVQVRIANTGRTPAFEMTTEHGVAVQPAATNRLKGDLWPKTRGAPDKRMPLNPTVISDAFLDIRPLSAEEKGAIKDGRYGIFAYGEVCYKDAVGRSHRSTYRMMYGGEAGAAPDGQFVFCEEGNEAT